MRERATGIPVLCAGRLYCDLIFTGVPRFPSLGTEVFAGGLGLHAALMFLMYGALGPAWEQRQFRKRMNLTSGR